MSICRSPAGPFWNVLARSFSGQGPLESGQKEGTRRAARRELVTALNNESLNHPPSTTNAAFSRAFVRSRLAGASTVQTVTGVPTDRFPIPTLQVLIYTWRCVHAEEPGVSKAQRGN